MKTPRVLAISLPFALFACGDRPVDQAISPRDPQVAQALDDPLMTDPDLSTRNEAAAALSVEVDTSVPVLPASAEDMARAKAEAAALVGGTDRLVAPDPPISKGKPLRRNAAPRERVAALLGGGGACGDAVTGSAVWSARLPAALPIYPRGHTLDAAGSDEAGCRVRTVAYSTPVAPADIMAFYLARARAMGGKGPPLMQAGADLRLKGNTMALAYDIYAGVEGGRTIVRLSTFER